MDQIKKQLRVNTLSLNFMKIYSILSETFFQQLDAKTIVSIPFINLLYNSYPDLMIRIFNEKYSSLYGYILRLKHPLFITCVMKSSQLLVECIRIHLERVDVTDPFAIPLGNALLDPFINDSTMDSFITSAIDPRDYELTASVFPTTTISNQLMNVVMFQLMRYEARRYIPLDTPIAVEDMLRTVLLIQSTRREYNQWLNESIRYLKNQQATNDYETALSTILGPGPQVAAANIPIVMFQRLKITRKLLHNISLMTANPLYDLALYFAFQCYPISTTLIPTVKAIVFDEAIDREFFANIPAAIDFYKAIITDDFILPNATPIRTDLPAVTEFKSNDFLRHSIIEENIQFVDQTSISVKKHNAAQLANMLTNKSYSPFLDEDSQIVDIGSIDPVLFLQAIDNKISIVPESMVFNNLTEVLDYYLPLIPKTSVTAIILLLLYNSSNHMDWISTFKKHKTIMRQVITRSSILLKDEKQKLITEIDQP